MMPRSLVSVRSSFTLLVALALCDPGCAMLAGFEDTRVVDLDACDDTSVCADQIIAEALGQIAIDADAADDSHRTNCGVDNAADQLLAWTAPVADYYVFDTFGSGFDTVLALAAGCGGPEIACEQLSSGNGSVSVPRRRDEAAPYTIAVADAIPGDGDRRFTIEALCFEACA